MFPNFLISEQLLYLHPFSNSPLFLLKNPSVFIKRYSTGTLNIKGISC